MEKTASVIVASTGCCIDTSNSFVFSEVDLEYARDKNCVQIDCKFGIEFEGLSASLALRKVV